MITTWKDIIWRQFGAAIDTLENAILACPEDLWGDRSRRQEYWYVVYHTLYFLDFYLSDTDQGFAPPEPFTLTELDPAGVLPERMYSKDELHTYLKHGRQKCQAVIARLTEEQIGLRCAFKRPDVTVAELLLYTMRHVQHHAAQLNLILGDTTGSSPRWVFKAKDSE